MILFKLIGCFFFIVTCTVNQVQAALPDISENDFNGHQGVIVINRDNKEKYLAVLAKKKILINQLQYKKQKKLSLKSKKILLDFFRKKHHKKINIILHHFKPVRYWEQDNYSYLISIVNEQHVNVIMPSNEEEEKLFNSPFGSIEQKKSGKINKDNTREKMTQDNEN